METEKAYDAEATNEKKKICQADMENITLVAHDDPYT